MNLRLHSAGLLLIAFSAVSEARADDARAIEVARKSYEEGLEQYKRGDVEGARLSLAQSYAAFAATTTLKSLAVAELDSGHFLDALKHFKLYTKDRNADPESLKQIPRFIDRCNEHVAHLRIVAPAVAAIIVDRRRVFDLREPLDVEPGTHTVTLSEPTPSETRTVNLAATQTVDVTFTREATAAVAAPSVVAPPEPATHAVPVDEGFWTTRHSWAVGLGAGAIASAAVGTVFGISAESKHSSYKEVLGNKSTTFCSTSPSDSACAQLSSTSSAQRRDAHLSTISFGIGGALLIGAVVAWVWPKASDARAGNVWLVPSVGQSSGGVLAGGHF